MRIMKRLMAALLMAALFVQSLPLKARAEVGAPITQAELNLALQMAGLRVVNQPDQGERKQTQQAVREEQGQQKQTLQASNLLQAAPGGEASQTLSASTSVLGTSSGNLVSVEAKESGYHTGMTPDETWDAQMLVDWLNELIRTKAYYVNHSFSQVVRILEDLERTDPATYRRLTSGTKNEEYLQLCQNYVLGSEEITEQAKYLRNRLDECTAIIQQNTETLANFSDSLFDFEVARLSEKIREITKELGGVEEDILTFSILQVMMLMYGEFVLDGSSDPEFGAWINEVLATIDKPEIRTGSLPSDPSAMIASNTRMTRMAAANRVLSGTNQKDFYIAVLDQNEFAITIRGKDNLPLVGVPVTLTDLNGTTTKTVYTEDPDLGIAYFNSKDFSCDFDQEMELSMTVDGTALGYRSFHVPWMIMRQGGHRMEVLKLLTDPDETTTKPYVYSCTFNDMDILRTDKEIKTSQLNNNSFDFALTVENPDAVNYTPPVLHYWRSSGDDEPFEVVMNPSSTKKNNETRVQYIYSGNWKQILSPDITKKQWPSFVFPDTGEVVKTKASPQRSKIDQPAVAGTGAGSPLRKVFGSGLSFNVAIPKIGGNLGINLPFQKYLPKVSMDPYGYLIVSYGTPLTDPKKTEWKNAEQERYDKGMKQYQHESFIAQQKQKLGTAQKYYKYMGEARQGMAKAKVDLGWFIMLAGKWEQDSSGDQTTYWNASGTAGLSFVFSFDYTRPFTIGPVPCYAGISFNASAGFGAGLQVKVLMNGDKSIKDIQFDFGGLTIEIRLSLTVTVGMGIKGICSLWVSASGALNIVLQFMLRQPTHVTIFAEFSVAAGFEFFFISYSKILWTSPKLMIYNSHDKGGGDIFRLLMSYAEADEASGKEPDTVQLEPENYPDLAPKAKLAVAYRNLGGAGIKTVQHQGKTYAFFIERPFTDSSGYRWSLNYCDLAHSVTIKDPPFAIDENTAFAAKGLNVDDYQDYDFDVYSDGDQIHIVLLCAHSFDEDGNPTSGMLSDGKPNIVFVYMTMRITEDGTYDYSINPCLVYPWDPTPHNLQTPVGLSPVCIKPHIESCVVASNGDREIYGTLNGQSRNVEESQYNLFYILPKPDYGGQSGKIVIYGDCTVGSGNNYGNDYYRPVLRTAMRNGNVNLSDPDPNAAPSLSFVALDRPREGKSGDSYLILYDYYMSTHGSARIYSIGGKVYTPVGEKRRPVVLAQGDIESFEVVQNLNDDKKSYSQTIFYTQTEKLGERTENRLKGIYLAPRTVIMENNKPKVEYEATYIDYDLSIPAKEFRAVTIGASQYLYWLETAPRKSEKDPDTYRLTGVYYDSATGSLSDRIVMAEFSMPQDFTWQWDNRKWNFVPVNVTLTYNDATRKSTGYIETRPKVTEESFTQFTPLHMYSFPLTLKPAAEIQGISLMESAVTQGEFAAADLTIMNKGNMGIGSFEMDVILMENGQEKEKLQTLYANLLYPADSKIVMKDGTVAAQGEAAIYRYQDLVYSARQSEWIVKQQKKKIEIKNGMWSSKSVGEGDSARIVTNVLVPGSLGGFCGNIKIPSNWHGKYQLRVKLTRFSAYANYLQASRLAQEYPALFAHNLSAPAVLTSGSGSAAAGTVRSSLAGTAEYTRLAKMGIQRVDYVLDEKKGKMVPMKESLPTLIKASASGYTAVDPALRDLRASVLGDGEPPIGTDNILLYAEEVPAPDPVNIMVDVHDIDVDHRVYDDYYDNEMLEITIHNYYNNDEPIRLYCTLYEDDSEVGRYYSLPHDQESISAGKTQTITVPLSSMTDVDRHEKLRVVIRGIGINDETATFNNEFTVYLGGTPDPGNMDLPVTGDSGQPVLWIGLILLGAACLLLAGGLAVRKRAKKGGDQDAPD